ncbi:hypothetical protein [Streptomyces sp. NPDC056192]|uniref:hypothetical protein n=1 Tax=unclassified Streptomyces TaxID=2593676 RepID=UPI0035D869A3
MPRGASTSRALPVVPALHGYVGLTVTGLLPSEVIEHGQDHAIASILPEWSRVSGPTLARRRLNVR